MRHDGRSRRWSDALRWGVCLALVLGFHAAGAMAVLGQFKNDVSQVASAPLIMVELAPMPIAPQTVPTELPPDLVQSDDAQENPVPEKPVEKIEAPPAPNAELQVSPPPKPVDKIKEKKPRQKHASVARAPSNAEHKAERAAAPAPGAPHDSNALPNWKSQLMAQLERHKRYPPEAQAHNEQGTVQLAFSIDRSGGVHNARIVHSSGSATLDAAALSLPSRAAPLPAPPAEVTGAQIAISVPIRYNMH